MSKKIAIAGKGGVGKTTTSGLIIRALIDAGKGTVLALDADPNSNLNEVLGVEVDETIGKIREDFKENAPRMDGGIFKDKMIEMNVHQALVEGKGFDLLVMGRGEGGASQPQDYQRCGPPFYIIRPVAQGHTYGSQDKRPGKRDKYLSRGDIPYSG